MQLRRRQLLADGVPVELGTRAFDLLLVLLEAVGLLITKEERLGRAWPGLVVSEENLKDDLEALLRRAAQDYDEVPDDLEAGCTEIRHNELIRE